MQKWLGITLLAVFIGWAISKGSTSTSSQQAKSGPTTSAQASVLSQTDRDAGLTSKGACADKVEQLQAKRVITSIRASDFSVVVDEPAWRLIPHDVKVLMAKAVGCAAVGPGKYIPLTIRSNLSDRVLADFSMSGLKSH